MIYKKYMYIYQILTQISLNVQKTKVIFFLISDGFCSIAPLFPPTIVQDDFKGIFYNKINYLKGNKFETSTSPL